MFFFSMKSMSFYIENIPFMSDWGHLIAAARYLERNLGIIIRVKFCLEHIIRNIIHKFGIDKKMVRELMNVVNKL